MGEAVIKGWRNNPAWVELYAKRDEDRIKKEIAALKFKMEMRQLEWVSKMNRQAPLGTIT